MSDREPLLDRVRRRMREGQRALDDQQVTRPHDWLHEPAPQRPAVVSQLTTGKEASMDEALTVAVGTEDGQVENENLDEHLKKWHRLPLEHYWPDEHLLRVHQTDHGTQGGSVGFDYHAHPIDG